MAKQPDVPRTEKGPLFEAGMTPIDPNVLPSTQKAAEAARAQATAVPPPVQAERQTTRGMLPELVAIDKVYKVLADLKPEERRFVLDFVNGKFPKEQA